MQAHRPSARSEPRRRRDPAAAQGRLHPAQPVHHGRARSPGFYSIIATLDARLPDRRDHDPGRAVCDVLDGRIARLTRSTSSFGVAVRFARRPGRVRRRAGHPRLHAGRSSRGGAGAGSRRRSTSPAARSGSRASTCRSASVEKRHFVGLPIPAAADGDRVDGAALLLLRRRGRRRTSTSSCCCVIYAVAALMVSEVRYFSLQGDQAAPPPSVPGAARPDRARHARDRRAAS